MINLPTPAEKYNAQDERETRRQITSELKELRALIASSIAAAGGGDLSLSGGTVTGNVTIGVGGTVLRKSGAYAGFGLDVPYAAALVTNGAVSVGSTDMNCFLLITSDTGAAAIVVLPGSGSTTTVLSLRGTWSGVVNTASAHNVYWDGAGYTLQNKTAGSVQYTLTRIGRVPAM